MGEMHHATYDLIYTVHMELLLDINHLNENHDYTNKVARKNKKWYFKLILCVLHISIDSLKYDLLEKRTYQHLMKQQVLPW